ncbi:MAG: [ribosomal protein S18]-alanine N-acetyltransferase [Acidobacteriota bacterium]|jgi:ribosomal-protein-alanine N-acetyltransferase|nr:[ribosomal protein S18]-alanine N-acetyltransferase [Acidobacteriota bacterium]
MAVLKKIRSRLFSSGAVEGGDAGLAGGAHARRIASADGVRYDVRPLTVAQLDECWRLDQRCFVDGEAYSRETFEYLLTSPESVSYRAVTNDGMMVGFLVGIVEPDATGHITTLGVAPEHRRRGIAQRMLFKVEDGFRRRGVRIARLEVRSVNTGAQELYSKLGFAVTQRLPRYYSNGGDGLLMIKSIV